MIEKTEEEEMEEAFEQDEEEVGRTYRKAERFIDGVHFNTELVQNEECDSCHHVKHKLIKFTALLELKSKNGIVVDSWWHSYCIDCLSKIAETKIEIEDKEIEGYM